MQLSVLKISNNVIREALRFNPFPSETNQAIVTAEVVSSAFPDD